MLGGGTWIIGLRSDVPGGQTTTTEKNSKLFGEITSVNVWNRVWRKKQLLEIMTSCVPKYEGNVKAWREFKSQAQKNIKLLKSTCCKT